MSHNHKVENYNRAFAIGIILNITFVVVEATYGVLAGSLALLADAGHNLSDVLSLLIAWGAIFLAKKPVTEKRTYGFRKFTIMASTVSAILLLLALGGITWEAIGRFANPQAVEGSTLIIVAAIGVVINTITALLFVSGHKHDLNIKGAFLHMTADAAISFGVVIAGLLILQTNWLIIDPLISIIIVVIILISTWSLLRDSVNLLADAVPEGIDTKGITEYLSNLKSVNQIHDLHIWALSTTETALTVHLVVTDKVFLQPIQKHLHDHFDIEHATIQIETSEDVNMEYDPDCH
jgi:cobalt-zinc-cadmium efflux system protein